MWPPRWGHFWSQTNLVTVHRVMLHTNYQDSMSYGFRREDVFMFFTISACVKHVTPGVGPFLAPGA